MATTYILRCRDNRFYIGSAMNFEKRLQDHFRGKCKFTKSRLPVVPVHIEEYSNHKAARKREFEIKDRKSRKYIENLIKLSLKALSSSGLGQ